MNGISVCCVMKSGGAYGVSDVQRLYRSVSKNLAYSEFVVLTDRCADVMALPDAREFDVRAIQLQHGWPGWWSKLEMWRAGIFEDETRILYLDLDTIVVGSLEDIAKQDEPWILLGDFYRRPPRQPKIGLASGVMMWTANEQVSIYKNFARTPQKIISQLRGDQDWIARQNPCAALWERLVPGQVVSYKIHCSDGLPDDARLVCFHGSPKPADVTDEWVFWNWKSVVPVPVGA